MFYDAVKRYTGEQNFSFQSALVNLHRLLERDLAEGKILEKFSDRSE